MRNSLGMVTLLKAGIWNKDWYLRACEDIQAVSAVTGVPSVRLASILAISSPRVHVVRNIRIALNYLVDPKVRPAACMTAVYDRMVQYDSTGFIGGPKVLPFRDALLGNPEAIVWDVWMMRALGLNYNSWADLPILLKKRAVSVLRSVSNECGLSVSAAQASIWAGIRSVEGLTHSDYSVLSEFDQFDRREELIRKCKS